MAGTWSSGRLSAPSNDKVDSVWGRAGRHQAAASDHGFAGPGGRARAVAPIPRGCRPVRQRALLIHYLPFAKILAAKVYSGRHHDEFEFGEYVQYATVGLLESVSRFDPARGVKFKTFAGRRIIGSILNGLEHLSEKQQQISFRKRLASERLESIRGRQPDGSNPDELFSYLAQVAVGLALGYILEDSGMYQRRNGSYMNNGYEAIETEQLQERMRNLVEKLPERERRVIKYHYMNHVRSRKSRTYSA